MKQNILDKILKDGNDMKLSKFHVKKSLGEKLVNIIHPFINRLVKAGIPLENININDYNSTLSASLYVKDKKITNRHHQFKTFSDSMFEKIIRTSLPDDKKMVTEEERVSNVIDDSNVSDNSFKKSDISSKLTKDFEVYVFEQILDNFMTINNKSESDLIISEFSQYCLLVMEKGISDGTFKKYQTTKNTMSEYMNHYKEVDEYLNDYEFFTAKKLKEYESLSILINEAFNFAFVKATNIIYDIILEKFSK